MLTAAVFGAMLVATLERNTHWKSDLTLQRQAVADFPQSFNAQLNLGKLELTLGNTERAVQHFRAAEQNWPGVRVTASWLSGALLELGRRDEARAVLRRAMDKHGRLPDLVDLQRRATAQ
jgi:lipopolysaccharide biosynthesis regulator YciM